MSHFAVAVLTDGTKTVSELLEPYQEHNAPDPVDEKYLIFTETGDEDDELDPKTGRYGYWENPNAKWDWYTVGGRFELYCKQSLGGTSMKVRKIKFDPERERRKAEEKWERNKDHKLWPILSGFLTKEQYIESAGYLSFRACVTPDGEWHEVSEMGWFGCSSESTEELLEWEAAFKDKFLSNPELTLTVVDCHI